MKDNIVTNNHAPSRLVNRCLLGPGHFLSSSLLHQHGVPVPKIDGRPVQKNSRGPSTHAAPCRHVDILHLAHQRPPGLFSFSLWFLVADPAICRPATAATSRNLAQSNSGIGVSPVPCPRDGDGDASTILRALAGPGHRLHLQLTATRPAGQQQNRHPSLIAR